MKGGNATAVIALTGALLFGGFGVRSRISQPTAQASQGFDPGVSYPHRDHTYDGYLATSTGLEFWQLDKLFFDVAMPQSHSAMVSFLGYPNAEHGDVLYWQIAGGSSELAVFYVGNKAYRYTVGGH